MLIELSEFNIKIFIPLIFPIFKRIQYYTKKAYLIEDKQIFKSFRYFLSYTISLIPFLIITYRTKNNNIQYNKAKLESGEELFELTGEVSVIMKKNDRKKMIHNIIFLFVLSIMGNFCYIYRYLFEEKGYEYAKQSMGIFFEIFDYIVLSYFILKQKLYKHHFASSAIIAFILIILFIITVFYMKGSDIFYSLIFYLFLSLCFGSYDVLGKKYMIQFIKTPYFLMFIIGITNIIFLIIFELFAYNLNSEISGIFISFGNNIKNAGDFFLFILDIIIQWIWNLGIWLTIYYLTPCHYFMSEYISEYIYYMIKAYDNSAEFYSTLNIVIFSISFFINFFCCLIFNEVIIINYLGLDFNTKKRIQERVNKDENNLKNELNFELNDNNDKEDEEID